MYIGEQELQDQQVEQVQEAEAGQLQEEQLQPVVVGVVGWEAVERRLSEN